MQRQGRAGQPRRSRLPRVGCPPSEPGVELFGNLEANTIFVSRLLQANTVFVSRLLEANTTHRAVLFFTVHSYTAKQQDRDACVAVEIRLLLSNS